MAHYEISPSLMSQGLHAHDFFEFYLHIKGGSQYCIDDSVFELKSNQLIIIPPLHMHGLVCDKDLVDYERCYLYLSPETLKKCGFNKTDLCAYFEEACNNKKFTQVISKEDGELICEALKKIEQKSINKKTDNDALSFLDDYAMILSILKISREKNLKAPEILNANTNKTAIYKILHYINQHFTEEISISNLSEMFHMSESSLSHDFKNYSKRSIYEYVLYKRIIKAKELLLTDLSLMQIALECGFNDYSNFLRVFKKFSNCSPKEYRTLLLN